MIQISVKKEQGNEGIVASRNERKRKREMNGEEGKEKEVEIKERESRKMK